MDLFEKTSPCWFAANDWLILWAFEPLHNDVVVSDPAAEGALLGVLAAGREFAVIPLAGVREVTLYNPDFSALSLNLAQELKVSPFPGGQAPPDEVCDYVIYRARGHFETAIEDPLDPDKDEPGEGEIIRARRVEKDAGMGIGPATTPRGRERNLRVACEWKADSKTLWFDIIAGADLEFCTLSVWRQHPQEPAPAQVQLALPDDETHFEMEWTLHGGEHQQLGVRQEEYPGAERYAEIEPMDLFLLHVRPEIEVLFLTDSAEPMDCKQVGVRFCVDTIRPAWEKTEFVKASLAAVKKQTSRGMTRRPRRGAQRTDLTTDLTSILEMLPHEEDRKRLGSYPELLNCLLPLPGALRERVLHSILSAPPGADDRFEAAARCFPANPAVLLNAAACPPILQGGTTLSPWPGPFTLNAWLLESLGSVENLGSKVGSLNSWVASIFLSWLSRNPEGAGGIVHCIQLGYLPASEQEVSQCIGMAGTVVNCLTAVAKLPPELRVGIEDLPASTFEVSGSDLNDAAKRIKAYCELSALHLLENLAQPWVEMLSMSLPLTNQDLPGRKKALAEKFQAIRNAVREKTDAAMDFEVQGGASLRAVVANARGLLRACEGFIDNSYEALLQTLDPYLSTLNRLDARFRVRIAGRELLERYHAASSQPAFPFQPRLAQLAAKLREELRGENGGRVRDAIEALRAALQMAERQAAAGIHLPPPPVSVAPDVPAPDLKNGAAAERRAMSESPAFLKYFGPEAAYHLELLQWSGSGPGDADEVTEALSSLLKTGLRWREEGAAYDSEGAAAIEAIPQPVRRTVRTNLTMRKEDVYRRVKGRLLDAGRPLDEFPANIAEWTEADFHLALKTLGD